MENYKDREMQAQIEGLLSIYADQLSKASAKTEEYEPGTAEYDAALANVATMTNTYLELVNKYIDIFYPEKEEKKKWYETTDWGRVLSNAMLILASAGEAYMVFKVQRDGYLIKNDILRIQNGPKY